VQTPLSKWRMTVRRYFVGRTTSNQRTPVVITTMTAERANIFGVIK
jgi:hypothetical protein